MSSAISLLSITADCVKGNFCRKMKKLLVDIKASDCEKELPDFTQLPWSVTHEAHKFKWRGAHFGWVDIIRREGRLLQVTITLRYSKRRWFSKRLKDWNRLNLFAQKLCGPGKELILNTKKGYLYQDPPFKLLLSGYKDKKHAFIEFKVANEKFYC